MKKTSKKLALNRQSMADLSKTTGGRYRGDASVYGCSGSCNTCQETCGLWDDGEGDPNVETYYCEMGNSWFCVTIVCYY